MILEKGDIRKMDVFKARLKRLVWLILVLNILIFVAAPPTLAASPQKGEKNGFFRGALHSTIQRIETIKVNVLTLGKRYFAVLEKRWHKARLSEHKEDTSLVAVQKNIIEEESGAKQEKTVSSLKDVNYFVIEEPKKQKNQGSQIVAVPVSGIVAKEIPNQLGTVVESNSNSVLTAQAEGVFSGLRVNGSSDFSGGEIRGARFTGPIDFSSAQIVGWPIPTMQAASINLAPGGQASLAGAFDALDAPTGDITKLKVGSIDVLSGKIYDITIGTLTTTSTLVIQGDTSYASALLPNANNSVDIGSFGNSWKDIYASGTLRNYGHLALGNRGQLDAIDMLFAGITTKSVVNIQEDHTDLSRDFVEGIANHHLLNPTGSMGTEFDGIQNQVYTSTTNFKNFNTVTGIEQDIIHQGGGTMGSLYGLLNNVSNSGTNTVNNVFGLSSAAFNSGAGTVGSIYGLYIDRATNNGGGTISNAYGLYIRHHQSEPNTTEAYNIYSQGENSKIFIDGPVGIATTTPQAKLHVINTSKDKALVLQAASSTQSANIFEYWNNAGPPNGTLLSWISASGGLGASGTSQLAHLVPAINNAFDLGSSTSSWRDVYASGTARIGGQVLISGGSVTAPAMGFLGDDDTGFYRNTTNSFSITTNGTQRVQIDTGAMYLIDSFPLVSLTNNGSDLGVYGRAWNDVFASGTAYISGDVRASGTITGSSTLLGLGSAGAPTYSFEGDPDTGIYRSAANTVAITGNGAANGLTVGSSITAQVVLSSQDIRPSSDNNMDLGTTVLRYRNFYLSNNLNTSGTSYLSHTVPAINNAYDLGSPTSSWRDVYASGTVRIGGVNPSIDFSATGTFRSSPTNNIGNSAFVFDTSVDLTGSTATSTAIIMLRDNGTDRLSIIATSSDRVVFRSAVSSSTTNTVEAFVFDTWAPLATNTPLMSVRNNGTARFSVSGGGNAYVTNSFISNSTPGDVAEYVHLSPDESADPGDVLEVDPETGKFRRTQAAYSSNVAGVVSDTGKFVIGNSDGGRVALALAGLVAVKVTDESGPISPGDMLVTSSKPGYAMKYDPEKVKGDPAILATALESLAGGEKRILSLVKNGWIPNSELLAGASSYEDNGKLVTILNEGTLVPSSALIASNGSWEITSDGQLKAKKVVANELMITSGGRFRLPFGTDQITGAAEIPQGSDNVKVLNDRVEAGSIIFLTPTRATEVPLAVTNVEDGSFTVATKHAADEEILFWYLVISSENSSDSLTTHSEFPTSNIDGGGTPIVNIDGGSSGPPVDGGASGGQFDNAPPEPESIEEVDPQIVEEPAPLEQVSEEPVEDEVSAPEE